MFRYFHKCFQIHKIKVLLIAESSYDIVIKKSDFFDSAESKHYPESNRMHSNYTEMSGIRLFDDNNCLICNFNLYKR